MWHQAPKNLRRERCNPLSTLSTCGAEEVAIVNLCITQPAKASNEHLPGGISLARRAH